MNSTPAPDRTANAADVNASGPSWLRSAWTQLRRIGRLLKQSGIEWFRDEAARLGASIAFYTIFALAPMLVIAISVAGFVFGEAAARGEIVGQINGLVGERAAEAVEAMIAAAARERQSTWAPWVGLATLAVAATAVFAELQQSFKRIWKNVEVPTGIGRFVRVRMLSFALVLGVGFLAVASLVASAAISALSRVLNAWIPWLSSVLELADVITSYVLLTFAFAALLKWLPPVKIPWRHVWPAALLTALLFSLGKFVIGMYLGRAGFGSTYGAAGSFVIVIMWVYYSSQIFLFGAEYARLDHLDRGGRIEAP